MGKFQSMINALIKMEREGRLDGLVLDDLPIQVYHHPDCPGLSSTSLKLIMERSFAHHEAKVETQALRFGNAFHCYNNEPQLFQNTYKVIPTENKKSGDWRSGKKAAEAEEKIPLSGSEFKLIQVMSKKLWSHPEAKTFFDGASFERTFFSRCKATGIMRKCRVDIQNGITLADLKSTENASKAAFGRDARKFGYDISAAYYSDIVSDVYDEPIDRFYLIACEKPEPNEIAVYPVSDNSMFKAQERIDETLHLIAQIQNDPKAWKGYPLGQELEI